MSRKRLGAWANERMTGVGVWKDSTRDDRGGEGTSGEVGVELEAAEGWNLQTGQLHHRVA